MPLAASLPALLPLLLSVPAIPTSSGVPGRALEREGNLALDAPAALPEDGPTTASDAGDSEFRAYWKNGLRLETRDKRVKLTFGGRFHNDWTWQRADDGPGEIGSVDEFEDGVQFRRARIEMGGQFDGWIDWYAAYDFADAGIAEFRDAYLAYRRPGYRIRLGQFKQPFSLEWQTSSNAITFMERGFLNQTIVRRGTGVMVHSDGSNERMTWGIGWFREGDDQSLDESAGEYTFTGRVTGAPHLTNGGESVVHLGGGASFRGQDEAAIRLQFEQGLADPSIDTGATPLMVEDGLLLGLEAAWKDGPLSAQAEVITQRFRADTGRDPEEIAWYAFLSWFVTPGDERTYDTSWGRFGKVAPARPLGQDGGRGAVELALRVSSVSFENVATLPQSSDALHAVTLGVNWYQTYNARLMFNYVVGEQDELRGLYQALGVRLQLFF